MLASRKPTGFTASTKARATSRAYACVSQAFSQHQGGFSDSSWVIAKGGSKRCRGSPVWQNICVAWHGLKPMLEPSPPNNLEDWENLPLWTPHLNHINPRTNPGLVRCRRRAQHRLRAGGLHKMHDIMLPLGDRLALEEVAEHITDTVGRNACMALLASLQDIPVFQTSSSFQIIYFKILVVDRDQPQSVWQFRVPNKLATYRWATIIQQFCCIKSMKRGQAFSLQDREFHPHCHLMHTKFWLDPLRENRICIFTSASGSRHAHSSHNTNGRFHALVDSSTAQLRALQVRHRWVVHTTHHQ